MDPLKRFEEEHQHGLRELERLERAALALANTEGSYMKTVAFAHAAGDDRDEFFLGATFIPRLFP